MTAHQDISGLPYRAPLNPAFVRKVMERRKREGAKQRRVASEGSKEGEKREIEMLRKKSLREAEQRAALKAEFEAAKAKLKEQHDAELEVERVAAFERALKALGASSSGPFNHTYTAIEAKAIRVFGVTKAELRGVRRNREIVFARQFVMYWACRLTNLSMPRIGRFMGGRDHTTCIHGSRAYVQKRAKMGRSLKPAR